MVRRHWNRNVFNMQWWSVVAARFIRTDKHMAVVSKNVCFDVLDDMCWQIQQHITKKV